MKMHPPRCTQRTVSSLISRGGTFDAPARKRFRDSKEARAIIAHSDQSIIRDQRGEKEPRDKQRAQTVHKSEPKGSPSREATRDPKLNDNSKTPGSGMASDDSGDAPSG